MVTKKKTKRNNVNTLYPHDEVLCRPPRQKITQADVDNAAKREPVEQLARQIAVEALNIGNWRTRINETEKQLAYERQQLNEAMLNHTAQSRELDMKLAIPQPVV